MARGRFRTSWSSLAARARAPCAAVPRGLRPGPAPRARPCPEPAPPSPGRPFVTLARIRSGSPVGLTLPVHRLNRGLQQIIAVCGPHLQRVPSDRGRGRSRPGTPWPWSSAVNPSSRHAVRRGSPVATRLGNRLWRALRGGVAATLERLPGPARRDPMPPRSDLDNFHCRRAWGTVCEGKRTMICRYARASGGPSAAVLERCHDECVARGRRFCEWETCRNEARRAAGQSSSVCCPSCATCATCAACPAGASVRDCA